MSNYKPQKFAELIDVSVKTLQRWDRTGILKAHRTPTNRCYYTRNQYLDYMNNGKITKGKIIIYTRVSTINQKEDLENQIKFLNFF